MENELRRTGIPCTLSASRQARYLYCMETKRMDDIKVTTQENYEKYLKSWNIGTKEKSHIQSLTILLYGSNSKALLRAHLSPS